MNRPISDFYQGTTSTATYHYITGNTNLATFVDANNVLQPGVYYVAGNINFAHTLSSTTASNVTLVATGSINISSPNMNFAPYDSQKMLFLANATGTDTSNTQLNISGSTGAWDGIAYAPHSKLNYSGSSGIISAGSIVAWMIQLSGNGGRLTYDPAIFGTPSTAEIFLYKWRAASRGGPAAGPGGAHARSISHHPGEAVPELGPPPSR